jgi:hypothetical protein
MRNGEPKNISRPFSSEQALLTGIDQLLLTFAEDKLCERSVLGGRSDPRYSMIGEWRALTLQRGSVLASRPVFAESSEVRGIRR